MEDRKTPSKPAETTATTAELLAHYHSQLDAYNEVVREKFVDDQEKLEALLMEAFPDDYPIELVIRDALIERIRRQNNRLGRHIKARAHELLLEHVKDADGTPVLKNGRSVGHTYVAILDMLAVEFPEASTTVACLRWYVVHMKTDADDEGRPWPPLPQIRPRSNKKKPVVVIPPEQVAPAVMQDAA